MYEVILDKKVEHFLEKLEKKDQSQILNALEKIRIRPEHFLIRLVGEEIYKMRVGTYRLYIDVQKDKLILLVLKIGHRKNVYKR